MCINGIFIVQVRMAHFNKINAVVFPTKVNIYDYTISFKLDLSVHAPIAYIATHEFPIPTMPYQLIPIDGQHELSMYQNQPFTWYSTLTKAI